MNNNQQHHKEENNESPSSLHKFVVIGVYKYGQSSCHWWRFVGVRFSNSKIWNYLKFVFICLWFPFIELLQLSCFNQKQCIQFEHSDIKTDCVHERCHCTTASGEHIACKPMVSDDHSFNHLSPRNETRNLSIPIVQRPIFFSLPQGPQIGQHYRQSLSMSYAKFWMRFQAGHLLLCPWLYAQQR